MNAFLIRGSSDRLVPTGLRIRVVVKPSDMVWAPCKGSHLILCRLKGGAVTLEDNEDSLVCCGDIEALPETVEIL